jgi:hypothetical protein
LILVHVFTVDNSLLISMYPVGCEATGLISLSMVLVAVDTWDMRDY